MPCVHIAEVEQLLGGHTHEVGILRIDEVRTAIRSCEKGEHRKVIDDEPQIALALDECIEVPLLLG
jgi:hypothetical protein